MPSSPKPKPCSHARDLRREHSARNPPIAGSSSLASARQLKIPAAGSGTPASRTIQKLPRAIAWQIRTRERCRRAQRVTELPEAIRRPEPSPKLRNGSPSWKRFETRFERTQKRLDYCYPAIGSWKETAGGDYTGNEFATATLPIETKAVSSDPSKTRRQRASRRGSTCRMACRLMGHDLPAGSDSSPS